MLSSKSNPLLLNLAIALSYIGGGMVSTGLTRTPEYYTPVWIPTGICTLFALLWGKRIYPGAIIGAVSFHFYFYQGSIVEQNLLKWAWENFNYIPLVLLQLVVARLLLLKFISDERFQPNLQTLITLTLRCAVLALVLPFFTNIFFLFGLGGFTVGSWFLSLTKWWFGDFLGIICLIPIPILIIQAGQGEKGHRILKHASVVAVFMVCLVFGYRSIANHEIKSIEERFEKDAEEIEFLLHLKLQNVMDELELMRIQFTEDRSINPEVFSKQCSQILNRHQFIHSISWAPMVRANDREEWEAKLRKTNPAFTHFKEHKLDRLVPIEASNNKPFFFPIYQTVPSSPKSDKISGLDLSESPSYILQQAFQNNTPHFLPPIRLFEEAEDHKALVIYVPTNQGDLQTLHKNFKSGTTGVFNVPVIINKYVAEVWKQRNPEGLHLQLFDATDKDPVEIIEFIEDTVNFEHTKIDQFNTIFEKELRINVLNRTWLLKLGATRDYLKNRYSSAPFLLLAGGLFVSYFLGIFTLANYLRTRVIEHTVKVKTQELQEAKVEAEHLAKAKAEFLAVMSHEIRTPMNGLIGTAEVLNEKTLSPEQSELTDIIEMSAKTLLSLINDILDFSKLEAGKTTLIQEPFDPYALMENVEATFRSKTLEKGIGLILSPFPQNAHTKRLKGDYNRLLQVVMNLVSNAVKFTEEGSITMKIEIEPEDNSHSKLTYTISDTGVGIALDKQSDLFEPFTQADLSNTRKFSGTGLGLAIVRRIVDLLNGHISWESTPGEGSIFAIEMVLENAPDAPINNVGKNPNQVNLNEIAPGAKILVVEDNAHNRLIMKILLKRYELDVTFAEDGERALDLVSDNRYQLILMDCRLPKMDGFEASRMIRKLEPPTTRVPIVALTANAQDGAREECLEAGMDDYISKPVSLESITTTLLRWVAKKDTFKDSNAIEIN